jgi:TP901 family phage tail tape measure protein
MALEKIGLGGVISVDTSKAVEPVKKARDEFGRFVSQTDKVPTSLGRIGMSITSLKSKIKTMGSNLASGVQKIGAGLRNITMGTAPLSLAVAGGVKQAVDFEKQMSIVGAVTLATAEDMERLEKAAKRMGIVSVFSATENAQAQEYLGRAGADTNQILASMGGVADAAAADELSLARASQIVAGSVKAMVKDWSKAGHVANVLAAASASSMTNIDLLGEGMKMAIPTANQLGMSYEEMVTVLAKLADSQLTGTMGGTAFTNMMAKLAKPSSKAIALMKKYNTKLTNTNGTLRSVGAIAEEFAKKIDESGNAMDKTAVATELFGLRGIKAFNALAQAGSKGFSELQEKLEGSSEAFNGLGVAGEMARRRLDNAWGAAKLLTSSLEGLSIALFEGLLSPAKTGMQDFTANLNAVLVLMEELKTAVSMEDVFNSDAWKELIEPEKGIGEGAAKTALQIAMGFADAIKTIKTSFTSVIEKLKETSGWFKETFGEDGVRKITMYATLFAVAAAAITPLILSLAAAKFVIGGVFAAISGVATILSAVFWPVVVVIGAVLLAYQFLKQENESLLETATRVWGNIKTWILDVWQNAIKPLWDGIQQGFTPAIEELGRIWNDIISFVKIAFGDLFNDISNRLDGVSIDWQYVGTVIGAIIGAIATTISTLIKFAIPLIGTLSSFFRSAFGKIWDTVSWVFGGIWSFISKIVVGFQEMFDGKILKGIGRIGAALLDGILYPLRSIIKGAMQLADAIGIDLPEGLKTFANEGVSGLFFGEEKKEQPKIKSPKNTANVKKISETSEKITSMKAKQMSPELKANVTVEDKKTLNIQSNLSVDGRNLNIASGEHTQEINDRAGVKTTPYQRRAMLEQGVALNGN